MEDDNIYVLIKQHIKAGEKVWNGYKGKDMYCYAPKIPEDAFYSLYEVIGINNERVGWFWEKEEQNVRTIEVGKKYRHFKGNIYEVIAIGKIWVRPLSMFLDWVKVGNERRPRFEEIEE